MFARSRRLSAVALGGLTLAACTAHAEVDLADGILLENGMSDIRVLERSRGQDPGLFDRVIPSKGVTVAGYFNGKTVTPSLSYPNPSPDTDPNTLTRGEMEAGLDQWWNDADGDSPSDAELAEFDEITGALLGTRLYTLANPVAAAMTADGHSAAAVRAALLYQPPAESTLNYQGLVFGAGAVAGGMTFSRAADNIARGLGVSRAEAEAYLDRSYGEARIDFFLQKRSPLTVDELAATRGDHHDASKYRKIEAVIPDFRPAQDGSLVASLHPGTQDLVAFPEPFDPGAQDSQDPSLLEETNMEVYAELVGAAPLVSRGYFYVENYRKVTQVDLEFTGALAGQQVDTSRVVATDLRSPNVLPYSAEDGGSANLELPDGAQVNAAFKAIAEMGDGINGYVKYHSYTYDRDTVLYWISPALVPGGMTTRWGTRWRGPGLGPTSGEDPSVIEELIEENAGLHWINPPEAMRGWLDGLLFDDTGHPRRPQVVNSQIKEAWNAGSSPFGDYSPFAVCNTSNGHIMKIPLQFDLEATDAVQQTRIFAPGDVVLGQNYTQSSPVGLLYKQILTDAIPPDKLPRDVQGNTIAPNGENLYLEASTCCGITSIIGGTTVEKHDRSRPNGQISVVQADSTGDESAFSSRVQVTASVPNDSRAAQNPVGEYDLLYPLSRVHENLPVLPEDPTEGVQGQDAKFYGDYTNDSPVFSHAPDHPEYSREERSLANPVDALGFPFMSLHGPMDREDPQYQTFVEGHRYQVTLAAWDNLAPLIMEPMPDRGIPGYLCYPIRRMDYRVYRADGAGMVTLFEGAVIPASAQGQECIDVEPTTTLPWIPRSDGPHFWEVEIEDLDGNTRTLVSQIDVTGEEFESQRLLSDNERSGE